MGHGARIKNTDPIHGIIGLYGGPSNDWVTARLSDEVTYMKSVRLFKFKLWRSRFITCDIIALVWHHSDYIDLLSSSLGNVLKPYAPGNCHDARRKEVTLILLMLILYNCRSRILQVEWLFQVSNISLPSIKHKLWVKFNQWPPPRCRPRSYGQSSD